MFCSECGKEINNDVKFCPFCGTKQILIGINQSKKDLKKNNKNLVDTNIKNFYEYEEKEFNNLNHETKREIILSEISRTNEYHWKFEKLNLFLEKFDSGFFEKTNKEFSIYKILKDENYLSEICKSREKSFLEKAVYYFVFIWVLNFSFANSIPELISNEKSEGWYIPGLSEITPMRVQDFNLLRGKGKIRWASQAEVWRINRRLRILKENINNLKDLDLNKIQNNFEELLK
tara:strand:- start:170 stop:865 length:696 start_codon:yes stop_codon:yes gene_type:complete